jgi:hypothetical protein
LTFVFIGLVVGGAFWYQPWDNDWELVRGLLGQARHHSLVGEWEVVKTISLNNEPGIVARDSVEKGKFKFTKKGEVSFNLVHPASETDANGTYEVEGTTVAMRDLRTRGDSSDTIKNVITMNLAWSGSDDVIAMDKTEAIFLKRHKAGNPLVRFMQMGLKSGEKPGVDQTDNQTRGVIGPVKRSMQDGDDSSNSN